jgi:hypothetical protein
MSNETPWWTALFGLPADLDEGPGIRLDDETEPVWRERRRRRLEGEDDE